MNSIIFNPHNNDNENSIYSKTLLEYYESDISMYDAISDIVKLFNNTKKDQKYKSLHCGFNILKSIMNNIILKDDVTENLEDNLYYDSNKNTLMKSKKLYLKFVNIK